MLLGLFDGHFFNNKIGLSELIMELFFEFFLNSGKVSHDFLELKGQQSLSFEQFLSIGFGQEGNALIVGEGKQGHAELSH